MSGTRHFAHMQEGPHVGGRVAQREREMDKIHHLKNVANSNTVSDEDRENAVAQIRELEEGGRDPSHVIAGLKAAQTNPRVSDEGRREAKEKLEDVESFESE